MRNTYFALLLLSLMIPLSCNDGDIITVEFDFDDTFKACEGVTDLVLYKTKNDPSESLSILIPSYSLEKILAVEDNDSLIKENLSATFNYRTYSNQTISNLFCNDIPNPDIKITKDDESSCTLKILTVLVEDDDDGVPAEYENQDPNGDGIFDDAQDTDNDGLPDYKDVDDDGDNVLTKDENPDPNGDGNLDDAQDTDGDGTPDYLDADDDGDGVLTRDEETDTQNNYPQDDITNADIGPDYLNPEVATEIPATGYRQHSYKQTFTVNVTAYDLSLSNLRQDTFDFGRLEDSALTETKTLTPDFN